MFYIKPVEEDNEVNPMEFDGVDNNNEEAPQTSKEAGEGNTQGDDNMDNKDNDDNDEDDDNENETQPITMMQSSQTIYPRQCLIEETRLTAGIAVSGAYEIGLTNAKLTYYQAMRDFPEGEYAPGELACVGAGIGGGFINTMELHVMKYNEAMASDDKKGWEKAVNKEHNRMVKHDVFHSVEWKTVPNDAKILTLTWVMKKKANGVFQVRLNALGYEQVDGEHYDEDAKFAPIVTDVTIHIILILIVMAGWWAELLDMKGAFLHGEFKKG
jgi:hypothetical protein